MSDQVLLDNYLLILKSTVEVFVHGTLESSNNDIRQLLNNSLNTILASQADTYDEMTKYGWYNVNNIDSSVINDTLNTIQNKN